jgi:hypothetical protein
MREIMAVHHTSQPTGSYGKAWQSYRRNRCLYLVLLLGVVPWFLLLVALMNHRIVSAPVETGLIFLWILLLFSQGWRFALWPCPRCGKAFRRGAFFAKRCGHCKLPIWVTGCDL